MDIEKLETEFKKVRKMPKDIQRAQLKDFLQDQGWFNCDCLEILIGKVENLRNRKNYRASIITGVSYPALLLVISLLIAGVSEISPENLSWVLGLMAVAAVSMIVTAIVLRQKTELYDLLDLLYDFSEELMEKSETT